MVHNTLMPDKTSVTIAELLKKSAELLQPRTISCAADRDVGRLEAEILLAFLLKKERAWLHAHGDEGVRAETIQKFERLVARRERGEPVAYIIGEKEFYGRRFFVKRGVLIPRPDTEILVEQALAVIPKNTKKETLVWDVGTGSGAIAVSLALEHPEIRVLATDVSKNALTLARKNAEDLHAKNIVFKHEKGLTKEIQSWFKKINPQRLVIVANLPYLPTSDKTKLEKNVVTYEPHRALFSGHDGLACIRTFLHELSTSALKFETAFLEYDPPQTEALRKIAQHLFPDAAIHIHQDLADRDRVLEINRSR